MSLTFFTTNTNPRAIKRLILGIQHCSDRTVLFHCTRKSKTCCEAAWSRDSECLSSCDTACVFLALLPLDSSKWLPSAWLYLSSRDNINQHRNSRCSYQKQQKKKKLSLSSRGTDAQGWILKQCSQWRLRTNQQPRGKPSARAGVEDSVAQIPHQLRTRMCRTPSTASVSLRCLGHHGKEHSGLRSDETNLG